MSEHLYTAVMTVYMCQDYEYVF